MGDEIWAVEDHLRGKPPANVELYHAFLKLVQACGPFTYAVAKSTITFKGGRRGSPVPTRRPAGSEATPDLVEWLARGSAPCPRASSAKSPMRRTHSIAVCGRCSGERTGCGRSRSMVTSPAMLTPAR